MTFLAGLYFRYLFLLLAILGISVPIVAQTEFDSLKRNSNLDTSFQPSRKPTMVGEFAELKISGFVQPVLYLDNNIVLNNDLFVTSEIPTTKLTDIKFGRFHMSANQSRLGFGFKFPKAGRNTSGFIEADFLSSTRGANTFFRLRHAYLTWGEFIIGQTWTNFGDVSASPNTLDLEGPNSMPASRVAQIRWERKLDNKWNIILALEEPKSDYTPLDSANAVKAAFPELVVKPKMDLRNGSWVNAVVYKQIIYTDKKYSFKKRLHTWGFTSSLSLKLKNKRKAGIFGVIGRGTQGSINDFGGLGYEAFPKDATTLESPLYYGGYLTYSLVLISRWSSTFVYSYLHQEQPKLTNEIFKRSHYVSGNGTFAINKFFTVGMEWLYGYKKDYDGSSGHATRIMALMRLIF